MGQQPEGKRAGVLEKGGHAGRMAEPGRRETRRGRRAYPVIAAAKCTTRWHEGSRETPPA
jgi:hypothetical protein